MTEVYTIQGGDTLTKIVKEKYGLTGHAAYQKALEIAEQNGIKNANLIYAGSQINLYGLGNNNNEPQGDNFQTQNNEQNNVENTYNNLLEAQRQYARDLAGLNKENKEPEKSFKIGEIGQENIEQDYINAILELTDQHMEEYDKEDENGVKDGVIDFDEFKAQQIAFYRSTYDDTETSDEELEQLMGLQDIFSMYDVDESGVLETNEVAFSYMAADANFHTDTFGLNPAINIENNLEFDGIINFDEMTENAQQFNEDYFSKLGTGKTTAYENIYNKVADIILNGIESRKPKANTQTKTVNNTGKKEEDPPKETTPPPEGEQRADEAMNAHRIRPTMRHMARNIALRAIQFAQAM